MERSTTLARRPRIWCWRRWIDSGGHDLWIGRLQGLSDLAWTTTQRPGRKRILLEVYLESRAAAVALPRKWGGRLRAVKTGEWMKTRPSPPIQIGCHLGRQLEIIHEKTRGRKKPLWPQLHIPHGVAFGSGEHATTNLLLRALVRRDDWEKKAVLDLGTGSGVLALTARLFGARRIVATDFDLEAVRTARQNEALNFSAPLIRWRHADVKKLRASQRYDLVLANLFSGILTEAAAQIAGCVASGGELWLSGILRSQQEEVIVAYRGQGLKLIRAVRRGKWIMLLLRKD